MYKLSGIIPKLETSNIEETITFYQSILDFKLTGNFKGNIFLSIDDHTIMFHELSEYHGQEKPIMTGSLYLNVNNIDDIYASIKDKVKLRYPLENFDHGMREFAFFDPNGYLIQMGMAINKHD